ncbi:MAG: 30S ribosomal protein S8 [Myxococcales bacterium]|jgi:small subunit ribosomal protein S8|nr:MAG: 30S ribosomal protein S8 [Myxococcales bacterium]
MSMTDPISDMLTRLRNGAQARHDKVEIPYSTIKEGLAKVLVAEGYVRDFVVSGSGADKKLSVMLRYTDEGRSIIVGIRRVSRPGLRRYSSAADAPSVRNGLGMSILSTPLGLLPDREARKRNVGGEVLCEIW